MKYPDVGASRKEHAFALGHGDLVVQVQSVSASMRSTPCCQRGKYRPKAACSLPVSRREFKGRRAGVGKALVGTATTSFTIDLIAVCARAACASTCFA